MAFDFHQKSKIRGVMYHKVTLGILAVITLVMLHSTWSVYQKKVESEGLKQISLQNVKELEERNAALVAKIGRIDTQPGLEEEIRSKFSVAKDNENVVVIIPNQSEKASTTPKSVNFWAKIKNLLQKK